jgi:uncharacterized protein YlxW (UPF0749 family)
VREEEVRVRVLVPAVALLAGLLFATSAGTARGTDLRGDRRLQLSELIAAQRARLARQQATVAALHRELAAAGPAPAAPVDDPALAVAAGLTAVTGPALTVRLDDAPHGVRPAGSAPDDLVIHQQDVQAVVNALWAGGAEAMTLMGQRVVATSAVRCVGNTLLLHGRVYSPPFVVTAVGDRQGMRRALDREPGVRLLRQYVDRYALGYDVRAQDAVTLPAHALPAGASGG